MNKENLKKALEELKSNSKKRKFKESVDLIFNLKDLDLKKPENQVDLYIELKHGRAKPAKVCALVGTELTDEAKKVCDHTVIAADFDEYKQDKKKAKKLANQYDFFIAQATVMPKLAQAFGRIFGVRKKMPNPKAGCVVPPKASLGPLYKRLQNTIRVLAKERLIIQCSIGSSDLSDEKIIENIEQVYQALIHKLPQEKNNIKSTFIKLTMSKSVEIQ
jgi:large subunit ribosomal protein L1